MATLSDALREVLVAQLGADALRENPEDLAYYGTDRCRGGWPVEPSAIVLPRTIEQVQAVVNACRAHGVAIVPSGGRTGLAGAATATGGELVVSMERMSRVLEIDVAGRTLRCEAGATVQAIQEAAEAEGLIYPVDWAAVGTAQVGGSIATNAGGIRVIRYGLTRDWVRGLGVVLASGEYVEIGGPLVKDNTGYDLRQLFVGSEGTLGLIVHATMGLTRPPAARVVGLASLPTDSAVLDLFTRLRASDLTISAFECFDAGCVGEVLAHRGSEGAGPFAQLGRQHVLIEVEVVRGGGDEEQDGESAALEADIERTRDALTFALADAQEAQELEDAVIASGEAQARALWAWREEISESLHHRTPHKADVSLPVARVAEFMQRWRSLVDEQIPEIPAVCFGHVGDGNLHLNLLRPDGLDLEPFLERVHGFDAALYRLVEDFRGSVSAEHGIGLLKRDHLHHTRSSAELAMMRGIKAALDPSGLFNPGKIFEPQLS